MLALAEIMGNCRKILFTNAGHMFVEFGANG